MRFVVRTVWHDGSKVDVAKYDSEKQYWYVDLYTLDNLIDFAKNHCDGNEVILNLMGNDIPTLEIYDDYRE